MKLLVCGGRDYNNEKMLYAALDLLNPAQIVHGDCRGADKMASTWAVENNIPQYNYAVTPEDWDRYGKGAPVVRNQQMLDEQKPDMVLAVQGGAGTQDMMRRARMADVVVFRLVP